MQFTVPISVDLDAVALQEHDIVEHVTKTCHRTRPITKKDGCDSFVAVRQHFGERVFVTQRVVKEQKRIGTFVARKVGDTVLVGWSKCNKRDHFNSATAIKIALWRALNGDHSVPVAYALQSHVQAFVERAKKYFKIDNVVVVGQ